MKVPGDSRSGAQAESRRRDHRLIGNVVSRFAAKKYSTRESSSEMAPWSDEEAGGYVRLQTE